MNIKETIESIYLTNTNYTDPSQAINQAESLKSLSSDLYTDAKRFIYELLQNADDSAMGEGSDVVIKLFDDILVLAHTGKAFTSRDIQGICSINHGTKKSDTSKTGFKGIGFKSVFGQSNEVTIYTNGEFFKFDANYDFEWKVDWGESKEKWEQENERDFLYPWQIIPIYIKPEDNTLDSEIKGFISNGNFNVATIIKVTKKDEIEKALNELSSNVNMFLFLKKINSIKFDVDVQTTISIDRNENNLILKKNGEAITNWLTNTIVLDVPSDLKELLKTDGNVPKKLQEATNIELTLAIKKGENGLEKLSSSENLLYAYLPTDEKRYSLPVLVNSTFLTSANRESLHTDSKWNQWLFSSISMELFKWIAKLVKGEYPYQAYDLIPSKLSVSDDLSNAYNKGIKDAIKSISFVLSKENNLIKVDEAIIDETNLSEKTFIGKKIIKKFIKHKVGESNKIVKEPFILPNKKLKKIGVVNFSWSDIPAFFAFEDFKSEHSIENNIKLIEYFKNELTIPGPSLSDEELKKWAFIYDHKGKLNYLNKICFPKIDDENWNNVESELDYIDETLYELVMSNSNMKSWLQQLGVQEKTDITYLTTVIIPQSKSYITLENSSKTIKYIYELYSNQGIKDEVLNQLNKLKLLTTKGTLLSASKCYFSDKYNPKLKIETLLDDDIFLSKDYLDLDGDIDEVRLFFKKLGVYESIKPIKINEKKSKNILIQNYKFKSKYFSESDKKFKPFQSTFTADEYKDIVYIRFLKKTKNANFSKLFWNALIDNNILAVITTSTQAYWGHSGRHGKTQGNSVENYPKWYIKDNKCIPTTKGTCEKSTKVFLNIEEIKEVSGKYLSVFDGVELSQEWKSFFKFKTELDLDDYLEILTNVMNDKNENKKLKKDNKKRVQLIIKSLLDESVNWGTDKIEKVKSWADDSYLADEDDNIVSCKELKYYANGDNSIFHNMYQFVALIEENKSHQNIETFLEYFGIEILRQDNFTIDSENEIESDLKDKLENIFPYLENWITKFDNEFDFISLKEKVTSLKINEYSKLSLTYDVEILKTVQVHLNGNKLLVTTPWQSNKSMLELPKVLCRHLDIKGYEDKLTFLLNANDESEIREYFEEEKIDLLSIDNALLSKETAIDSLDITEKEFDEIKHISDNFHHTSQSDIEKLKYIQKLLNRSKKRVLEHLDSLDEYDCKNVDSSALTILSGIKKNGNDIYIIPRPSDNGKVILYYESEYDTLEYADSELWYEDGTSTPKKLTFGKVLREAKINKIPIVKNNQKNIIDIVYDPENEDIIYESISPSSFDIAKAMASLANTNGGYLIIGCTKESEIVGIDSEFDIERLAEKAIEYSDYFKRFSFEEKNIDGKIVISIKVEKSDEDVLIDNKKYILFGSIITEDLGSDKPLIITEGKTDWKHLKKALERFQKDGLYTDLDIEFLKYENMNMGDGELDRMVQTYSKIEQPKRYIFMFDRDNTKYVKNYAKEEFNNHGNNIYSFCIPKINDKLDEICIEFYYKEVDLTTKDKNGKKIFIGKEFNPKNGISKCGKYMTEKRNAKELDILDRDKKVYLIDDKEWENNIALSKNDFTNNVINDIEGFNNFDIENFKLIFDVIVKVVDND